MTEQRRRELLQELNAAYARLREQPAEWAATLQERDDWDVTLSDGLVADEAGPGGVMAPRKARAGNV